MKISVELLRVKQEFDPDTMLQTNSMVIRFANKIFEIECTTEETEAAIREAMGQKGEQAPVKEDIEEDIEEHKERVFGGDLPAEPPLTFTGVADETAAETPRAKIRARARARIKRGPVDEDGFEQG